MHSHIDKAYQFLEKHLPFHYVTPTQLILKKASINVTEDVIRNVRNKKNKNIDVLNALLKVAKKNLREQKKLEKALQE